MFPFCRATNVPILDFWLCLPWVSKTGWISHLHAFLLVWYSSDSPHLRHLLTSWRVALPTCVFLQRKPAVEHRLEWSEVSLDQYSIEFAKNANIYSTKWKSNSWTMFNLFHCISPFYQFCFHKIQTKSLIDILTSNNFFLPVIQIFFKSTTNSITDIKRKFNLMSRWRSQHWSLEGIHWFQLHHSH